MLARKAQFLAMLRYFGKIVEVIKRYKDLYQSLQSQQEEITLMTTSLSSLSSLPHFGDCVKKLHAQKGISQREVAEKIGMDAGNYNRLLNRPSMSASTLWSICKALDVKFGDIA